MAHIFDAKFQYPDVAATGDNSNPVSLYMACNTVGCTLVVLDINYPGGTARTGGAPTINGVTLTQVPTTALATEQSVEKWFGVFSHFLEAGQVTNATIPTSLEASIPNAGGLRIWGVLHTYKAGVGKVSAFDVSTCRNPGTTAVANPSGTIYPTTGDYVVTVVAGFGANTVPTSSHVLINTLFSHDPATYTFFEGYRLGSAVGSVRVNFTMASDDWVWILAAWKEANAPVIAQKTTHLCSSTLSVWDSEANSRRRRGWETDTVELFDGDFFGATPRDVTTQLLSPLSLFDSAVAEKISLIAQTVIQASATDTLQLTDQTTRAAQWTRIQSLWLSLTDSQRQSVALWRQTLDTLGLTDQQRGWVLRLQSALDTLQLADGDASGWWQFFVASMQEEMASLTDATARTADRQRTTAPDTLDLTDSVTQEWITALRIFLATATDTLPLFDGDFGTLDAEHQAEVLDTLVLSDAVVREYVKAIIAGVYDWSVTDTLTLTDTLQRTDALTRAVIDWLRLDDTQRSQRAAWARVTDTLGLTETQRRTLAASMTRLDSLFVFDATTRELRLRRAASDALLLFEQTQRQRAAQILRTDTLLLTDVQKTTLLRQLRATDALPLSDARASRVTRMVSALDALQVTDRVVPLREAFRKLVDYLAPLADSYMAEGTTGGRTYLVQAFDVLDVADNSTRRQALTRSLLDYLAAGDYAGAAHAVLRRATEALGLTDNRTAALLLQRAAVDWTLVADVRVRQWYHNAIVTDRLDLTDAQLRQRKLTRFELDVLALTDTVIYNRTGAALLFERSATDVLAILDQLAPTRQVNRVLRDLLGVTDLLGPLLMTRLAQDLLQLTDRLTAERHFHVRESTEITDQFGRILLLARVALDDIAMTDASGTWAERGWTVGDALLVDDQFARTIEIILRDSLVPTTDTITRWMAQAVVTVLSGIRVKVSRLLGTKLWIRNVLPRWQSLGVPLPRKVKIIDIDAAYLK